ncbi:MAG: molybdenum ABC transporter ATP-binding protein [Candidatus Acidiferrum sp.]
MLSVHIEKEFRTAGKTSFQLKISEEFSPGFTVLFGPSGAGKSTLLDCIAGLVKPDKGIIKLGGEIFFDAGGRLSLPAQKRGIGYVFQSLALFPHLSVVDNVAYGLSGVPAAERTARMRTILDIFHAQRLLGRKPGELSGGEKQRVALARSVITEPRVLLLDEPLTGLDGGLRQSILEDLRSWNVQHRIPILYVTHNREEVDAIGDRVVAMVDGRVRARGMPQEVLDAPSAVELAQAAGFENLLVGRVLEHRVEDGVMRVALDGNDCELEVPLGPQKPGDIVQVAIRAGDILVATQLPYGLSARNVLPGTVESIETRGTIVSLQVNAGVRFAAHVTPGAMRSLELEAGSVVWLVVKTHSCHVVTPR